ncbi:MAG: hypothetical protein JW843_06630 [Candidatus Aminicenantes bacterium]|nr:hypothetical protein [Candidatus Aminicenantes bacterium]
MNKDDESMRGWSAPLINESEIFGSLGDRRGTVLFLGRYTANEVSGVLAKMGFFKEARKRGLWPIVTDLDSSEYPPLQRFRIFHRKMIPDRLIVDLKIREGVFTPAGKEIAPAPLREFSTLVFEWLTLQNPEAEFSEKQGSLPGQQHPGLGMSKRIMDIFIYLGKTVGKDGLLAFPAYYHNAVLFSRYFKFVEPSKEAEVQTIRRTFNHVPIKQMAWIVHLGCLKNADGSAYEWRAEEQVLPLARDVREHFESRAYRERVKDGLDRRRFSIDWDEFERKHQGD